MKHIEDDRSFGNGFSEFTLWAGAGLMVLSIHVGTALWLLRDAAMVAADDMPPAAIMIELAEMPEAQVTEENEVSPDQETADASAPAENVEEPKEKPVKQRQQEQAVSRQLNQAQAQVTQSSRNAARQSASGLFASSVSPARWQSRLMAHLERRKRYPAGAKSRREEGVVYVRFRIDETGKVLSASLARSSGFPELDSEVLSLVQRASPVPAPPPDVNRTITAPVKFSRR